jgi:transcriptional regulator with XRE-family HTH domain
MQQFSVGQALRHLRLKHGVNSSELQACINVSSSTYLKIERDERDLTFLMALRVCYYYDIDIHDFIAMIKPDELERKDLSSIRVNGNREKKKKEAALHKV